MVGRLVGCVALATMLFRFVGCDLELRVMLALVVLRKDEFAILSNDGGSALRMRCDRGSCLPPASACRTPIGAI